MAEEKQRAPFRSSVTNFDDIRKRMDEIGIKPFGAGNGVDGTPQPVADAGQDLPAYDYGCAPMTRCVTAEELRAWRFNRAEEELQAPAESRRRKILTFKQWIHAD